MGKTITIRCKNTGKSHKIPLGFTLEEVYDMLELNMPFGATSAKVNNKVEGLHFMFFNDKDVEFLDITSPSGLRTYTRSLFFVLHKAVADLYPSARLRIDTPVSNGYYCCLAFDGEFSPESEQVKPEVVEALKKRMQEIVAADMPFHRITCPTEEAIALFRRRGLEDKAQLLESCGSLYTHYYTFPTATGCCCDCPTPRIRSSCNPWWSNARCSTCSASSIAGRKFWESAPWANSTRRAPWATPIS